MNKIVLKLKEPVRVIKSRVYDFILRDADDVRHYFLKGKYDGYDRPCKVRSKKAKIGCC